LHFILLSFDLITIVPQKESPVSIVRALECCEALMMAPIAIESPNAMSPGKKFKK